MKENYEDLFKSLAESYVNGNFEDCVKQILSKPNINKEYLSNVISSLCGIKVDFTKDFIHDLKNAISNYNPNHKVVEKIRYCSADCKGTNNGSTLCQSSCPFDAIFIDKDNNNAYIDGYRCTDCGFCVEACPSGSILDKVEFIPLIDILKSNSPVIAAVAPAISGQFANANINQLRSAFKKLGFTDMIEVAFFADMLTLKEAAEFDIHVNNEKDLMITSCCCPMWVGMVKRVYKDLIKYVSPSISPMIAAGRVLKKLNPDCKVVFVGPCVAKKAEAKDKDLADAIDFVLTFSELEDIFNVFNIKPQDLKEDISSEYASKGGRLYARTGGVSIAIGEAIERLFPEKYKLLKTTHANGIKKCKEMLSKVQKGDIHANFMEGMGCIGGCVGGPKAIIPREIGKEKVDEFAEKSSIKVPIDSNCMIEILNKIGIKSVDDFKEDNAQTEIFEREF
ncbi:[Fe-Fe] hydrogenase large subunit C-terminal domain-containing protein [Clostridium sp. JN-1]|uniref:[Fe-Fe] hydrogenase large subunit C-terminal domain-containing protein n=1 Tax=Clostridium sp. JN-1 TaxID=2483110 RepID=UPI000F0B2542|nr:[Fe-Fe] hydrogenase large subunit C-terminal domain-containing protein [Clostridium sp. JN-1]